MASTWGSSWGTSWGDSWGTAGAAVATTSPTGGIRRDDSHLVEHFRRRKRLEKETEEPEKPPLEIIKIGKASAQTITGLVAPVTPPPKTTHRSLELERLASEQFNADQIRGKKLRQLQQADDEWLMLN